MEPDQETIDRNLEKLEAAIWASNLDSTKKLVLLAIKRCRANQEWHPSVTKIASLSQLTPRTVQRMTKELSAMGVLEIRARNSADGTCLPNSCRINASRLLELADH